ncbi:MAG: archease [Armatimonadota bacterium]|nr:archease [bacterium]MDW8320621.1 archease [Armatimonadota bacterium]
MSERTGYQILEHTADKGVRAWGKTLEELFENASRGMYRLVIDPEGKQVDVSIPISVEVSEPIDRSDLLVKWLRELIYLTDVQKVVFTDFTVRRVTETAVAGEARGLVVEDNSILDGAPVKAVTYHGLRLDQTPEGWEAEFYVDV